MYIYIHHVHNVGLLHCVFLRYDNYESCLLGDYTRSTETTEHIMPGTQLRRTLLLLIPLPGRLVESFLSYFKDKSSYVFDSHVN